MGNCCSCCGHDRTAGQSAAVDGRNNRYEKLTDEPTPDEPTPDEPRRANGQKSPPLSGEDQKDGARGAVEPSYSTLLELAQQQNSNEQPPADVPVRPTEEDKPETEQKQPGPFADPSAISRSESIAPSEKPWLVENVTEADYKADDDEDNSDKNFYKEQKELQKGAGTADWTRNRRRAIHRTGTNPASKSSSSTTTNTPPVADSSLATPAEQKVTALEQTNESRPSELAAEEENLDISGGTGSVMSDPNSIPGLGTATADLLGLGISKDTQPVSSTEATSNSDLLSSSGEARNSNPPSLSGEQSSSVTVPDFHWPLKNADEVSQPLSVPRTDSSPVPPADSSSDLSAVVTPTGASQTDSGVEIRVSSDAADSLPGGFTPPRQQSGAFSGSVAGIKRTDSAGLTESTSSADSSWRQSASDLTFGPGQVTSSCTTANRHIGDILLSLRQEKSSLMVDICEGRNIQFKEDHNSSGLSLSPQRWDSSSIYVKCYVESKGKHVKQKTSTVSASPDPKINETLKFKPPWQNKQLRVMIWADHLLSRNLMLGEALIDLSAVKFSEPENSWYSLFSADESLSPSVSVSSLSSFTSPSSLLRQGSGRRSKRG